MKYKNTKIKSFVDNKIDKHHWSWEKVKAYFKAMVEGKSYFLCGLPYQLAIRENLLDENQVKDEMSESDFDSIGWLMEMECLFFGESDKAFFKFDELEKNRVLTKPIYPKSYYSMLKDKNFKYTEKQENEIRLVSCDIAGMKGKKNDASVYTIMRLILNKAKNGYDRHVVYMESLEGGHSTTQALRIRQLFDEFDCDYIVIDTQSFGLGIFDQLVQKLYDKELEKEYEAFGCVNDEVMHERCLEKDAPKKIYSIKGTPAFNSESVIFLKDMLQRGKIRMLVNENEGRDSYLSTLKGYGGLSPEDQAKLRSVYMQINALINEMVNLEQDKTSGQYIKLKEPSSGRKDRYSSVLYANAVAKMLEKDLKDDRDSDIMDYFFF